MTTEPENKSAQTTAPQAGDQYDESWLDSLLRPLLIVAMATCIDVVALVFVREYMPWFGAPVRWTILVMGIAVATVGCITSTWLAHPGQRLRRTGGFRAAEVVLLVLVCAQQADLRVLQARGERLGVDIRSVIWESDMQTL